MAKRMIVDVQNHVLPLDLIGDAVGAGIIDIGAQPPVVRWRGVSFSASREEVDVEEHLRVCRETGLTHIMLHHPMIVTIEPPRVHRRLGCLSPSVSSRVSLNQ